GQGEHDMPQDDRRGQPAGGGTLAADVVFDEPDSQQVQPEERGDEPADQCGNAHISPSSCAHPVPGRGHQAGKTPRPATAGSGTMCPPKAVTPVTDRNPVPVNRPAHGVAGATPAGSRDGCTTPP